MIQREVEHTIHNELFKGRVILVFGMRRVGKTTLLRVISDSSREKRLWLNGDEYDIRSHFEKPVSSDFVRLFGDNKLIIIDEAQQLPNIGLCLKIMVDNIPDIQIIATGSSAFELADKTKESLTGRKYEYMLYPFSYNELLGHYGFLEQKRLFNHQIIYGAYPEVLLNSNPEEELKLITDSYLYKDVLALDGIKKSSVIVKLLRALALQIGSEVSYNELSNLIEIDRKTVERYIDILEKTFVIFTLEALSRNLRNEIKQKRKIYFWDNGIRNALLNDYKPLEMRIDKGALFENYFISERLKYLRYNKIHKNVYFWRTHNQAEIDLIEERNGKFTAFEVKLNPKRKAKLPKSFATAYPEHDFFVVNKDNFGEFLIKHKD